MKFAPLDKEITSFLKQKNFKTFDPYLFSGEVINEFLNLLFNASGENGALALSNTSNADETPTRKENKTSDYHQLKVNIALILSIVSLVISLVTLDLLIG